MRKSIVAAFVVLFGMGTLTQARAQAGAGASPGQIKEVSGMAIIPAGEFWMGRTHTWYYDEINWMPTAYQDDKPVHVVYLDPFYMDKYETTNEEYDRFATATKRAKPWHWGSSGTPSEKLKKLPVYNVNWDDAVAYCTWAGKRLPTEAEWEKAARGGLTGKLYPWGDEFTGPKKPAGEAGAAPAPNLAHWGFPNGPAPVGSYPPNGYGLYDVAGNVWEWVNDWYDADYYAGSPEKNPMGPETGRYKVVRGNGWSSGEGVPGGGADAARNLTGVHYRNFAPTSQTSNAFGFRCAKSADQTR